VTSHLFQAVRGVCTPGRVTLLVALVTLPHLVRTQMQIAALISTLLIAAGSIAVSRIRRRGRISPRLLFRALFPRRLFVGPSMRADVYMTFLNTFLTGGLIGWALLSAQTIQSWLTLHLVATFGPMQAGAVDRPLAAVVLTLALFVATEFAYWVDHYLSHVVPFLWEFHRVHHTAETLTPLTVFRVHPIDSLVFYNMTGLVLGVTQAGLGYLLGYSGVGYIALGTNLLTFGFVLLVSNLLHTHVWIAFTGVAGKLFISPAHHQLHHSVDPAHHGRNLGNALAIFDWMFGTLLVPAPQREKLVFGVPPGPEAPHSIIGTLLAPCLAGWQHLRGETAARRDFQRLSPYLPNLEILAIMASGDRPAQGA